MIALYIVAIVVVCGLVVFYFCWTARKRKRALEQLGGKRPQKQTEKNKKKAAEEELVKDLKEAEKEVIKEEKKIEAELEDFAWDEPKSSEDAFGEVGKFGGDVDAVDENLFESKMEDYERFLREEQEEFVQEEQLSKEEQNDIDALMGFDFDSLKGKTRDQVVEMIKDLSPTVQDFILNDIFERRNSGD